MDEILESMKDSDYAVYAVPKKNPYIISKAELKQMLTESKKSVKKYVNYYDQRVLYLKTN